MHDTGFESHEEVLEIDREDLGIYGVIAVHSTALGPAAGGCRIWNYKDRRELLEDALRLSKGMTYKNAMAGLPLGGGKAVLHLQSGVDRRLALHAFASAVDALKGRYITAEDVGSSVADMGTISEGTRYVAGLPSKTSGRAGGDPSPWTALGVFLSIQACVRRRLGTDLNQVKVAVQGLGNVGATLCQLLSDAGARLIVADIDEQKLERASQAFGLEVCPIDKIHAADVEVFAPCALGSALSVETLPTLKAKIVCGAANNQLSSDEIEGQMIRKDILYAPDYIVNAGGIINVASEWLGYSVAEVEGRVREIPLRLSEILDRAERQNISPSAAAEKTVTDMLRASGKEVGINC